MSFLKLLNDVNPSNDPQCSNIATSLFQLSKFDDCLTWCDGLAVIWKRSGFASCSATLELNRHTKHYQCSKAWRRIWDPPLLNNFANLLITLNIMTRPKIGFPARLIQLRDANWNVWLSSIIIKTTLLRRLHLRTSCQYWMISSFCLQWWWGC